MTQLSHIYAADNKSSMPFGFVPNNMTPMAPWSPDGPTATATSAGSRFWSSVLGSLTKKGSSGGNLVINSSAIFKCPSAPPSTLSYAANINVMTDTSTYQYLSGTWHPGRLAPATLKQLYPDTVLFHDKNIVGVENLEITPGNLSVGFLTSFDVDRQWILPDGPQTVYFNSKSPPNWATQPVWEVNHPITFLSQ